MDHIIEIGPASRDEVMQIEELESRELPDSTAACLDSMLPNIG